MFKYKFCDGPKLLKCNYSSVGQNQSSTGVLWNKRGKIYKTAEDSTTRIVVSM